MVGRLDEITEENVYTLASSHLQNELDTIIKVTNKVIANKAPDIYPGEKRTAMFMDCARALGFFSLKRAIS